MDAAILSAISEIQLAWKNLDKGNLIKIQSTLQTLAKDPAVQKQLKQDTQNPLKRTELHRDEKEGFVLISYAEEKGTYRQPHNHGEAWVIYAVATGEVEMGNYFKANLSNCRTRLVEKGRERLTSGDTRIYYPGEIHETLCLSENAIILRLTSNDLKEEEKLGRMLRFDK